MINVNVLLVTLISFSFTIFVLFYFLGLCKRNKKMKIFLIINIFLVLINNTYSMIFSMQNGVFLIHTFLFNYIVLFSVLILFNNYQNKLITKDELTGLNNRFALMRHLENINNQKNVFLIIGDIDKFKKINDDNGHDEGDNVLKKVSNIFKEFGKNHSELFISRYGGDEFVFVYSCNNENNVKKIISEMEYIIKTKSIEDGNNITMSFGYSKYNNSDFKKSFKEADEKMYKVKNGKVI